MDYNYIRFSHFIDKKAFGKLQTHFGQNDFKRRFEDPIENPLEDFTIMYHEVDEFYDKDEYTEITFLEYLYKGLENISDRYIDKFQREINDRGIYSEDQLEGFAKYIKDKIASYKLKVRYADYLGSKLRSMLMKQIEAVELYITTYFKNPYPNIKQRIEFKWNRNQIIYFFHLLRENKQINWIENSDLGRVIDNAFSYIDPSNPKNYFPINGSRKHLSDFRIGESRPASRANKALKSLLQNDDFYAV